MRLPLIYPPECLSHLITMIMRMSITVTIIILTIITELKLIIMQLLSNWRRGMVVIGGREGTLTNLVPQLFALVAVAGKRMRGLPLNKRNSLTMWKGKNVQTI